MGIDNRHVQTIRLLPRADRGGGYVPKNGHRCPYLFAGRPQSETIHCIFWELNLQLSAVVLAPVDIGQVAGSIV